MGGNLKAVRKALACRRPRKTTTPPNAFASSLADASRGVAHARDRTLPVGLTQVKPIVMRRRRLLRGMWTPPSRPSREVTTPSPPRAGVPDRSDVKNSPGILELRIFWCAGLKQCAAASPTRNDCAPFHRRKSLVSLRHEGFR